MQIALFIIVLFIICEDFKILYDTIPNHTKLTKKKEKSKKKIFGLILFLRCCSVFIVFLKFEILRDCLN